VRTAAVRVRLVTAPLPPNPRVQRQALVIGQLKGDESANLLPKIDDVDDE
jgi:hypothetical protein